MKLTRLLATTLLVGTAVPAMAQTTPAFRVPLEQATTSADVDPAWSWIETVGTCSTACGTGVRTTSYQCQDVTNFDFTAGNFGEAESDAQCSAAIGSKPENQSASCSVYSGCSFDWVKPDEKVTVHPIDDNPVGRPGCGNVQREFDPHCERSDNTILAKGDHGFCAADLPDYNDVAAGKEGALGYDRTRIETNACNESDHRWVIGGWGPSSSTCSTSAFKTRSVSCERKFDGSSQPDSACSQPKPAMQKAEADYSSCTYSKTRPSAWKSEETCSSSAKQTRTFDCRRSNGDIVPDRECTSRGVGLTETRTRADYSSCTYKANFGSWSAWSSNCSAKAHRTRTADCLRSDGETVSDGQCISRKISLTPVSETEARYGSCTYSADFGSWSGWSSDCSATATRTRSVQCRRSDGSVVADKECSSRGISLSPVSQTQERYGSCSYSRVNPGAWSDWANSCSSNTSRTRTYQCRRSNGDIVADRECTSRGINLRETRTGSDYSSCSYGAKFGSWSSWSSNCSSKANRTRTVDCLRSDGKIVADSQCTSRGISLTPVSETTARFGSCAYSADFGNWSAWSSNCSTTATRTRSVQCRRSDGSVVADRECTSRGISLSPVSQTSERYGSCSYSRVSPGSWSSWASSCSSNTSRTRTYKCQRSNGDIVASSECTSRGISLTQSDTGANYAGCNYSWSAGAWGSYDSSCSATASRTRSVQCRRSDGKIVSNGSCSASSRPATSQTSPQYGGCDYRWIAGAWSGYNSTCSSNATRTRSVVCRRSDGTNVSGSYCGGASKPATSQTSAQYGGCGYSWVTGGWSGWSSSCSSSAMRTRSVQCRRSDGQIVADRYCSGVEPASSQTAGRYSGCGYTANYGEWSSCSGSSQSRTISSCMRSDGVAVSTSHCKSAGYDERQTQACTNPICSFEMTLPVVTISADPTIWNIYDECRQEGRVSSCRRAIDDAKHGRGSYASAKFEVIYNGKVRQLSSGVINSPLTKRACADANGRFTSCGSAPRSSVRSMTLGGVTYTLRLWYDTNTAATAVVTTSNGGGWGRCGPEVAYEEVCSPSMFGWEICNPKRYIGDTNNWF